MKTNVSPRLLLALLSTLLAFGSGLTPLAAATDPKPAPNAEARPNAKSSGKKLTGDADAKPDEKRPPLKLAIDRKPINRDAPDRVSYAPIVKKTAGSVVFVYSTKTVKGQDLTPFLNDPMLRRFFDQLPGGRGGRGGGGGGSGGGGGGGTRRGGSNRLPDQVQQGLGSGVIITADGYVLTNNHVVEDADDVKVSIGESSKKYDAKVIGRDSLADIAVLKIEATGLTPAVFGDSEQLQVGDVVLAIGNPFGVGQSVSRGIVSALSRGVGIELYEDFIQTDAAINPGNSGGALIDSDGRVVGINTAILSRSGGFAGVGFAIPINMVRSIVEQIVNTGKVDRGFLGVRLQELDADLISQFHAEAGALVSEIEADSPAEKAGLKPGDVITKINDTEIRDDRHLMLTISQLAPDSPAVIQYLRDGKPRTANVKLAHRTDDSVAAGGERSGGTKDVGVLNGVTVGDITADLRQQLHIPAHIQGAVITEIDPDSPSAQQGLREGDVIVQLDGRDVKNAEEAVKLSEEIKGPKVTALVCRDGRNRFLVIDEAKK
jgi:serine protease Do